MGGRPHCQSFQAQLHSKGMDCAARSLDGEARMGYWMIMATWRRMFLVAHVWLTAFMTLIVSTPHFDCRCPDGRIKPFCLALLTGKTGCCCESSCCSVSIGVDARGLATHASPSGTVPKNTCCCCNGTQENAGDESRTTPRLGKAGCQKTLTAMVPMRTKLKQVWW